MPLKDSVLDPLRNWLRGQPPAGEAGDGARPGGKALVAVLDDDPTFRQYMVLLLRASGYEAAPFAAGPELIEAMAQRRFDCLLLDLEMPGMNGIEVLNALQAQAEVPPVIVLTGHTELTLVKESFALKAFDYQVKTAGRDALMHSIQRAIALRAAA